MPTPPSAKMLAVGVGSNGTAPRSVAWQTASVGVLPPQLTRMYRNSSVRRCWNVNEPVLNDAWPSKPAKPPAAPNPVTRASISYDTVPSFQKGGIRKLSVSLVLLRCGLATTVIDAPGLAAIGELPFAASNQGEREPLARRTRMRPLTPATTLPPKPARPCRTVTRTTVGFACTRRTVLAVFWMLCVTSTPEMLRLGRREATTFTSRVAVPQGPVTVRR